MTNTVNPDIRRILGAPDSGRFAKPGEGGAIIAKFGEGIVFGTALLDLYIYEKGPKKEPVEAYISKDGVEWVRVGCMSGGKAWINYEGVIPPGEQWPWLKVGDASHLPECLYAGWSPPQNPGDKGPDIDAVGAEVCSITFRTAKSNKPSKELAMPFFDSDQSTVAQIRRSGLSQSSFCLKLQRTQW